MSLAESITLEVSGIATRLERRVRRQPDGDLEKAAALLRLMNQVLAANERRAAKAARKAGRLN
jgi:hypothetical protein